MKLDLFSCQKKKNYLIHVDLNLAKLYILGLKSSSRTTVLLQSLSITPVSTIIKIGATNVLKSCIASNTTASHFYIQLLKRQHDVNIDKTLLGHVNALLTNNSVLISLF